MWIRTKDKLVNTRHLGEIKIVSMKMNNGGCLYEVAACPARKENQLTVLGKFEDKSQADKVLSEIAEAIGRDDKEFTVMG